MSDHGGKATSRHPLETLRLELDCLAVCRELKMKLVRRLLPALAMAACFSVAGTAAAQDGNAYGVGLGFGYGAAWVAPGRCANSYRIPYFALHPPVYYGEKVARPYGFTPFATPPGIVPAEVQFVPKELKEIANPFYREESARSARAVETAPARPAPRNDKTI